MSHPYVVIGGDAAGMSAASKIKRTQPDAEVIVFEKSEHISYSACGMPYWIAGAVGSDEELLALTPAKAARRGLDVRMHHEAVAIDPAARSVTVRRTDSGEVVTQPYHKLIIATGASAVRPPLPGMDLPGVFTLRALSDSQRIHAFLAAADRRRAVVVGAGYIGIEIAEALRDRGLAVDVVELMPQLLPNFDVDMVEEVTAHVREKGVTLHLGEKVLAIEASDDGLLVTASDGAIAADLVVVAVGVRPNSAIAVDDHLRTSDPHIYAAGDCVEYHHLVLGRPAWVPLAPSANKGGRIAGANMTGGDKVFPGILGTLVVKVFDFTLSATGLTEKQARESGIFGAQGEDVGSATITGTDRAGYYPGAGKITVKMVYQRSNGRILGAQIAGVAGVNKRIDIVATAIAAGMDVEELGMLDLSYAPPYSPVYDPVQVAANVAAKE